VAILGAGGAAVERSVALALARASRITVVNRKLRPGRVLVRPPPREFGDVDLAISFVERLCRAGCSRRRPGDQRHLDRHERGDPSPDSLSVASVGQVVADMVYRAEPTTPSSCTARRATQWMGFHARLPGATAIDIWRGDAESRAPRDVMREAPSASSTADLPLGRAATGHDCEQQATRTDTGPVGRHHRPAQLDEALGQVNGARYQASSTSWATLLRRLVAQTVAESMDCVSSISARRRHRRPAATMLSSASPAATTYCLSGSRTTSYRATADPANIFRHRRLAYRDWIRDPSRVATETI